MYFNLLFKKKRIYSSVSDFSWKMPRQWRVKNRITYKATGKKKQKKKKNKGKKKRKKQYLFQGNKILDENMWLDPVAPLTSLIPCLFPRAMGALCPSRSQEYQDQRLFCHIGRCFFCTKAGTGLLF